MFLVFKLTRAFVLVGLVISNIHAMSDKNARLIKVLAPVASGLAVSGAINLSKQSNNTLYTAGFGIAAAALVSVITFKMIDKTPNSVFKDVNKALELADSKLEAFILKDFPHKDATKLTKTDLLELSGCKIPLRQAIVQLSQIKQYLDGNKQEESYNSLIHKIQILIDRINVQTAEALTVLVHDELNKLNSENLSACLEANPNPLDWAINLCNDFYSESTISKSSSRATYEIYELSPKIRFEIAKIRYLYAIHLDSFPSLQPIIEAESLIVSQKNIEASIAILNSSKTILLDLLKEDHFFDVANRRSFLKKIEESISDFENKIIKIQQTDGYLQQLQSYYEKRIEALIRQNKQLNARAGSLASYNYRLQSEVSSLKTQMIQQQIQTWTQPKNKYGYQR